MVKDMEKGDSGRNECGPYFRANFVKAAMKNKKNLCSRTMKRGQLNHQKGSDDQEPALSTRGSSSLGPMFSDHGQEKFIFKQKCFFSLLPK